MEKTTTTKIIFPSEITPWDRFLGVIEDNGTYYEVYYNPIEDEYSAIEFVPYPGTIEVIFHSEWGDDYTVDIDAQIQSQIYYSMIEQGIPF